MTDLIRVCPMCRKEYVIHTTANNITDYCGVVCGELVCADCKL